MLKVGITGGIGSGKSYISGIFKQLKVPVFNADIVASQISRKPEVASDIISAFGDDIVVGDMEIDRKKLAGIVFNDPEALKTLNEIIHPKVEQIFTEWLVDTEHSSPYILKEAAILFESGSHNSLDRTINVYAPLKLRIERTLLRDRHRKLSEIEQIIMNQMNEEERARLVDHIIVNDDCTPLLPQVMAIDKMLRNEVH